MQLSTKKIYVFLLGQDNIGWSIDNDRKNTANLFINSREFKVTKNIFKANIIYSVWYNVLERPWYFYPILFLKKIKKIKIFAVITNRIENTPEKITKLKNIIDIWVAPSEKTYHYIKNKKLNSIHIPFLIDNKIFHTINKSKKELAKILAINYSTIKDKTLIGSFQRDSLGSNLSQPKWQKDPKLLISILKRLPKGKFILVLAGPRRHYIINQCKKNNIPYIFVGNEDLINKNKDDIIENNLSLKKINLLYNLIDIYLVTSKSEGGPKAILEAAATKTLIFSTDVGLASDILHPSLIYKRKNITRITNQLETTMNDLTNNNLLNINKKIAYNATQFSELTNQVKILNKIKQKI